MITSMGLVNKGWDALLFAIEQPALEGGKNIWLVDGSPRPWDAHLPVSHPGRSLPEQHGLRP